MELLVNLLNHLQAFNKSEYIEETKSFLNKNGFTMAIDNKPLDNPSEFKLYHLDTENGVYDWVIVKIENTYYAVNLYTETPYEEAVVIKDSETDMIREFFERYSPKNPVFIFTINEKYEAIDTKIIKEIKPKPKLRLPHEKRYTILIDRKTQPGRGGKMYDLMGEVIDYGAESEYSIYELFEFCKEFKPEIIKLCESVDYCKRALAAYDELAVYDESELLAKKREIDVHKRKKGAKKRRRATKKAKKLVRKIPRYVYDEWIDIYGDTILDFIEETLDALIGTEKDPRLK